MESLMKRSRSSTSKSKQARPESPLLKRSLSDIFQKETTFGNKSKMNLKYISGPVSWTGFEFGNKAIHFFGDRHFSRDFNCEKHYHLKCSNSKDYYPNSDCITIDGLIKAIFETSDKKGFYVDFFMESPYETKKIKPRQSVQPSHIGYFSEVYNYVIEYINSSDNTRAKFHPIDIRSDWTICDAKTIECKRISLDLFTFISLQLFQSDDESDVTKKKFGNDIVKLFEKGSLDYYKSDDYILFIKNLIKKLSTWKNKTSFHKEFLIKLREIITHLNTYGIGGKTENTNYQSIKMLESLNRKEITFKGINISEYIQEFFENEKKEYLKKTKNEKGELDINLNFLLEIGAALMDIATLTKIFKRLENNDEPQVMIVFAGNDHIKSYVKFFTKILGLKPLPESISYANKEHIRCLVDPNFSKIFGKWIELDKIEIPEKSPKEIKRKKSNETPTSPKEIKRKKSNVTPRQSKRVTLTTPRKSRRVSKPMETFSKQYDSYY
jgi:hypothetical protein